MMKMKLESFSKQEFLKQVWSKEFSQKVYDVGSIPSQVFEELKDQSTAALYALQVNQHQEGLLEVLHAIEKKMQVDGKESFVQLAVGEVRDHLKQFVHLLATQCQNNLLNYLQMKYGKTEEIINDKAEKVTTNTIQEFLEKNRIVVLDFWAPWCAPCVSIAPMINQLAEQYEGRTAVGKVNIDENEFLVKEYKIASIPTLLFIKDGKVETQLVGLHTLEVLQNNVERLLESN